MTPADLQLHIRYSNWASRLLLDAVRALPPGELEKPTGISHHSILRTMTHLHFADWIWYTRVAASIARPAETLQALESDWPDLQQRWETFCDGLSDADLARPIAYRSIRGGHKMNHAVLTALLADRTAWRVVEGESVRRPRLQAETGRAIVGGRIAAAYGPDVS